MVIAQSEGVPLSSTGSDAFFKRTRIMNSNIHTIRVLKVTLAASLFVFAGLAVAQQKHPISISSEGAKTRFVQQLAIDVDDLPGHQVRTFENHRIYATDNPTMVAGERIVESFGRGLSNYVAGIGPVSGYTTLVTDKGNKIFLEFSGSSETRPTETGSKRGTYRGTARFVGGTGQFMNIRGYLVEEAKYDTDPETGYNFGEFSGEYWFAH
jgi:hypothetical protein